MAPLLQQLEKLTRELLWCFSAARVELEIRREGRLVRRINARKIPDFSAPRLGVEPLRIAFLARRQRGVHKHLQEGALGKRGARGVAVCPVRRDEGYEAEEAGAPDQLAHLPHSPHIL